MVFLIGNAAVLRVDLQQRIIRSAHYGHRQGLYALASVPIGSSGSWSLTANCHPIIICHVYVSTDKSCYRGHGILFPSLLRSSRVPLPLLCALQLTNPALDPTTRFKRLFPVPPSAQRQRRRT
ncbi:hypothetical protein CDL15_Pgr008871 [Punica granatum]|uniref:Uncharacterized protein n=1 Tax=Punica granatum TaxID=22663 RepID=A0A218VZ29_PUNGR|nr:hypothetical protein CDL15_Pgr008871 [Punica granatum]